MRSKGFISDVNNYPLHTTKVGIGQTLTSIWYHSLVLVDLSPSSFLPNTHQEPYIYKLNTF